jgi:aconitate hydratase
MINGLGVVGWGVGGIEAEAVMLGQPMDMLLPDVIGFKLHRQTQEGVTATDLVLTVTQMLRKKGVVDKFVEFYGPGSRNMSLTDRATIANMAPEYGATMGYFPVDEETLRYMRLTGRSEEVRCPHGSLYARAGTLPRCEQPEPEFTDTLELDLGNCCALIGWTQATARPRRADRYEGYIPKSINRPVKDRGYELSGDALTARSHLRHQRRLTEDEAWRGCDRRDHLLHEHINPSVLVAAGLVAKKAVEKGLNVKPYVKTSLAPGSRVVTEYLKKAGLIEPLSKLGFNVIAYGCTTCIGNSGPLPGEVAKAVTGVRPLSRRRCIPATATSKGACIRW